MLRVFSQTIFPFIGKNLHSFLLEPLRQQLMSTSFNNALDFTIFIISNYLLFKEGPIRYTKVPYEPLGD